MIGDPAAELTLETPHKLTELGMGARPAGSNEFRLGLGAEISEAQRQPGLRGNGMNVLTKRGISMMQMGRNGDFSG